MKLQLENHWKLRTAIINRPLRLQTKKLLFLLSLNYKTRANTQQVLPVQTGFYPYDAMNDARY